MAVGWLSDAMSQLREQAPPDEACQDHLVIAGHTVRVRYASTQLAEALSRATRHLAVASIPGAPDLTIDCGVDPALGSCLPSSWPEVGTAYSDDGSIVFTWDAPAGPLVAYDRTAAHAWACFKSLVGVPPWERATPFRRILHCWAADQGFALIHAAAVGQAKGGVLLVGRGGSGKSTTALACLEAGLGFAGDDYCLVAPGVPPSVHGLYLSAKGDPGTAALLPNLRPVFERSDIVTRLPSMPSGKSVIFVDELQADGIRTEFPLTGIVVPRISGESDSRSSRLRPAAALRALAPSTLLQIPGQRDLILGRLGAIAATLPAWELTLGSPGSAAAAIRELLDRGADT